MQLSKCPYLIVGVLDPIVPLQTRFEPEIEITSVASVLDIQLSLQFLGMDP